MIACIVSKLSKAGLDRHKLTVQVDQPVLGRPFQLYEHEQVTFEGMPLTFVLERHGSSDTVTVRFTIGVGSTEEFHTLEASPGRSATVTTRQWLISVGDLTHDSAALNVERR